MTTHRAILAAIAAAVAALTPSFGAVTVTTNDTGIVYDISPWQKSESHETTAARLAWAGKALPDIVVVKGTMAGGWMGTYYVEGLIYNRTDEAFQVQFQTHDGGTKVKIVRAELAQTAEGVTIRLTGAAMVDSGLGTVQPDSVFSASTTPIGAGGYGVKGVEAYGDVYEVNEFPVPPTGGIIINGGALRVNVSEDVSSSAAISGNGRLWLAEGSAAASREVTYSTALPKDSSWVTVVADAQLADVTLTGAVMGGGWVEGSQACGLYNAATQADGSIIVQLQRLSWGASRCVRVQIRQAGVNVQAKGLDSYATSGDHLGEDATSWGSNNGGFSQGGYIISSLTFSRVGPYGVTLTGAKSWKGGTKVDGVRLNVRDSILPDRSTVKVVNGGILELAVGNEWNHYPNNTYDLAAGTKLLASAWTSVNLTDTIIADAADIVFYDTQYLNKLTLKNGATVSGATIRVGNVEPVVWRTYGSGPCVVSAPIATVKTSSALTLTFDTGADFALGGGVSELNATYAGMQIVKTGAGKLTFGGGVSSTANLTLAGGTLAVGNGLTAAGLVLTENSTLEIASGKTAQFGASSGLAWTQGKILTLVGAFRETDQTLRFGTDENGLIRTQARAMRKDGLKSYLDAEGWVRLMSRGFVLVVK